jgi:hypothetical protein
LDLERAAAERLRRQREVAARETATAKAAEEARAKEEQHLRQQAKEFFSFARRHGAPLLRHYLAHDEGEALILRFRRTPSLCVAALPWGSTSWDWRGWAVDENGTVHPEAHEAPLVSRVDRIRDARWFYTREDAPPFRGRFRFEDFSCAAAALLESLPVGERFRTGVQDSGWIGYRLD